MGQSRAQNSIKNSIVALLLRLLQIAFPFIIRTIIIHSLGLAYVGVSGLFASIFGVLNIAELGVGSALLQALYEPIKNNDKEKINAIIAFYKRAYFYIGLIVSVVGLAITPFLKYIIKAGTYPDDLNIYFIYLIGLVSTAIGYMIYAYKSLLLEAFQKGRVANKVRIVVSILEYGVQIPLLIVTKNYYLYIIVGFGFSIFTILMIAIACNKELPGYIPVGKLPKDDVDKLGRNISSLFLYKIGSIVNNNVDGIVISVFLGATILGAYNNYYLIVSSISALITVTYTAILPSVGQVVQDKSKEENYSRLIKSATIDGWLNGWCAICFACLLSPFIKIWAGEESVFGEIFAALFGVYFFFWRILDPVSMYKDALGLWWKDKWRPLTTALVNLVSNIILVHVIGIYGILLSTIIAVATISFPFSVKVLMNYLGKSSKQYLLNTLKMILFVLIVGIITWFTCRIIKVGNEQMNLIISCVICLLLPNALFGMIYGRTPAVKDLIRYVKDKVCHASK